MVPSQYHDARLDHLQAQSGKVYILMSGRAGATSRGKRGADLIDSPSNLVMAVKTTVRAGMFRPMAKVSVAKSTCTELAH